MYQNSNENKLTSVKSFNYLNVMVLLKSLLINYHYLVNALIIFANILMYVGSSQHRPFEKNLSQYLDFCIFDKLFTMLIFYPSYVIKHVFDFMLTQLIWSVL